MNLEQLVYSLPSTQSFVRAIADDSYDGVKVVIIPDNLSREMVGRLIRNRMDALRLVVSRLFDTHQASPVSASAGAMNASWQSPRTLRSVKNLLRCENLPDILYIHKVGPSHSWIEFIEDWAREYCRVRNAGDSTIPSLCVIAKLKDFDYVLPRRAPGLAFHWWWGFPSVLEVRLSCRIASEQFGGEDVATSRWREYVLPGLVGGDVQLAEHMWGRVAGGTDHAIESLVTYWTSLEHTEISDSIDNAIQVVKADRAPYGERQELPKHLWRLWAGGGLVYTREYGLEVHPALLAYQGRRASVEHMIWRGQSELLLPMVNEIRLKVCQNLTETLGSNWAVRWVLPQFEQDIEDVRSSPLGTELGHVNYLLQNPGIEDHRHDLYEKRYLRNLVLIAKALRNSIAHYSPVTFQDYRRLCDEWNRVEI